MFAYLLLYRDVWGQFLPLAFIIKLSIRLIYYHEHLNDQKTIYFYLRIFWWYEETPKVEFWYEKEETSKFYRGATRLFCWEDHSKSIRDDLHLNSLKTKHGDYTQ